MESMDISGSNNANHSHSGESGDQDQDQEVAISSMSPPPNKNKVIEMGDQNHDPSKEPAEVRVMRNELILAKIAKKLPVSCLLNLRSTFTKWNFEFIPQLKEKHSKISVYGGVVSKRHGKDEDRNIGRLIEVMESSPEFPFTAFRFTFRGEEEDGDEENDGRFPAKRANIPDRFMEFITMFGYKIRELDLTFSSVTATNLTIDDLKILVFDFCTQLTDLKLELHRPWPANFSNTTTNELEEKSAATSTSTSVGQAKLLPNLKRFAVGAAFEGGSSWNSPFTQLAFDVIRSAEGLEKLKLLNGSHREDGDNILGAILPRLAEIPYISKLKALSIPDFMSVTDLQALLQLGRRGQEDENQSALRLETFSVLAYNIVFPETQDEIEECFQILHDFLITQSPTLKELKIHFEIDEQERITPGRLSVNIPRMEQLEKLKICNSTFRPDEIAFTTLQDQEGHATGTFMDTFPRLRQFSYQHCEPYVPEVQLTLGHYLDVQGNDAIFHSGVTNFKFKGNVVDSVGNAGFCTFCPVLPSLTCLELTFVATFEFNSHICAIEFSEIWIRWPELTFLKIDIPVKGLDFDLDVFLSGVPRVELQRLSYQHQQEGAANYTLDSLRAMLSKFKIRPGLSDLKQLRNFSITFAGKPHEHPQLTDMGAYLGLALASPTLQHLVIQGPGKNLVSDTCLAFLRNTFGTSAEICL